MTFRSKDLVTIAMWSHLFPSRTQKLSTSAAKIALRWIEHVARSLLFLFLFILIYSLHTVSLIPAQFFYMYTVFFRILWFHDGSDRYVERLSLFQQKLHTCTCRTASACIFRSRCMRQESGHVFIDKWLEGRTVPRTVVRIFVWTFSGINALDRILDL